MLPGRRRLKTIWWLKPLAIAGAWAVGGVVVPAVEAGRGAVPVVVGIAVYRLLLILPNVLLADWLDRAGDARAGLGTAATHLGPEPLRRTALGLLGLGAGVGAGLVGLAGVPAWLVGLDLVGYAVTAALLWKPWPGFTARKLLWLDLAVA